MEKSKPKLAEYIRDARDEKGIKYKWLAEELGTTQSNLSHKLAKDSLYAVEFIQLAIALNMDLNKMMEEIKKKAGEEECISKD